MCRLSLVISREVSTNIREFSSRDKIFLQDELQKPAHFEYSLSRPAIHRLSGRGEVNHAETCLPSTSEYGIDLELGQAVGFNTVTGIFGRSRLVLYR